MLWTIDVVLSSSLSHAVTQVDLLLIELEEVDTTVSLNF